MQDHEFLSIAVKLSTIWPERFKEQLLSEWQPLIRDLPAAEVVAAIDDHHRGAGGAPTCADIRRAVDRRLDLQRSRLLSRTSQYLHQLNADGAKAKAEEQAMRDRLGRLSHAQWADLLERALLKLGDEMPPLSAHFRAKGAKSVVVLATMVALLGNRDAGELAA